MITSSIVGEALETIDRYEEPFADGAFPRVDKPDKLFTDSSADVCQLFSDFSTYSSKKTYLGNTENQITDGSKLETGFLQLDDSYVTYTELGNDDDGTSVNDLHGEATAKPVSADSDTSSSFGSDSDGDTNLPAITTLVSGTEQNTDIKQNLKDKIRLRRESEGAGDIPVSELFEPPKAYELTPEEERRNEIRKARNRKSATKSRLKRIEREKNLEKECEKEDELNTKLQKEVKFLKNLKALLERKLSAHILSQNCNKANHLNVEYPALPSQHMSENEQTSGLKRKADVLNSEAQPKVTETGDQLYIKHELLTSTTSSSGDLAMSSGSTFAERKDTPQHGLLAPSSESKASFSEFHAQMTEVPTIDLAEAMSPSFNGTEYIGNTCARATRVTDLSEKQAIDKIKSSLLEGFHKKVSTYS